LPSVPEPWRIDSFKHPVSASWQVAAKLGPIRPSAGSPPTPDAPDVATRLAFVLQWLAVLFAVGRFLFWIGYQIHPIARAIGFGLTAVPTAIAIVWLAWRVLAG
jgi:hypothetical protein